MSNCPLCNLEPAPEAEAGKPPIGFFRRIWSASQWLFPTALMVLIPKCPLCVAADIALFSGIGVSVSTARWIQILLVVLCLTSLAYLVVRFCRRRIHSRREIRAM